jgi:hypothetical protein
MRRRTRLALAAAFAAAIGVAVALVAFRVALAETLLIQALLAQGVPSPRLMVAEIGWRHSRITDIRLGDADEITLHDLRLDYGLSGLLAGRLDKVTANGLAITVDLTGTGPSLGSLNTLLTVGEPGDGGADATPIPNIEIEDLRLVARTATGVVQATGRGRMAANLAAGTAVANLSVEALTRDFSAEAVVKIENALGAPRWRLELAARAVAGSTIWAAWPGPVPMAGRVEVSMQGEGAAPPLSELIKTSNPAGLLSTKESTVSVIVSATDVTIPEHVVGLNVGVQLTLEARDGMGTMTLQDDATLAVAHLSPTLMRSLGVPDGLADTLAQGLSVRVQPIDEQRPVATITRDGDAVAVALDGAVQMAIPNMADLSLSLPADVRIAPGHIGGRLRAPADLHLSTLRDKRIGELLAPVAIVIPGASVDFAFDSTIDYRVSLESPAVGVRLNRTEATAIEATITPGRISASPKRIDIEGAGFAVPAYEIGAEGMAAGVDLAGDKVRAEMRVAALRHTGTSPLFAPLTLAGTIGGQGSRWQGTLSGNGPGGVGRIEATGDHDSTAGQGSARFTLPPLSFSPGGAQPGVLVPALAALQQVTGTAEGDGEISWSADGARGSGTVALRAFGFNSPQARVEGLDLNLHLDSLIPPGSPPRQTLTVRRLEAGLPLERLAISFQIQPAEPSRLAIEMGEVFFGSGRLAVAGLLLDPAAVQQRVDVNVEDLSLSELFALLGIDGLSGEGRLSGAIPIHFAENAVIIENGHLAAGAPGIVRFRSEQAAQILAGQGESLDLVLRALEDFHYDELTVDLSKTAADVGRIKLSLLGKNPAVLEGHPFRFNISIEANTGKLVTALTTIYQVPNDLLRRAWTSGQ